MTCATGIPSAMSAGDRQGAAPAGQALPGHPAALDVLRDRHARAGRRRRLAARRPGRASCAFSTTAICCCRTASATTASTATPTCSRTRRSGMLFLVPGMAEILRINGLARVTDDAALLAPSAVQGRAPKVGLLIEVREAYLHCAKAINRAALWDPVQAHRPRGAAELRRHAGRPGRGPDARGKRAPGRGDGETRDVLSCM